jgi:uncharacterized protein (UPF0216 family)
MFDSDEVSPEEHKQNVQKLFAQIIDKNDSKINCENYDLTSQELEELADILKEKKFTELNLSLNGINSDGMEALQIIILNNSHLKKIDLEANKIDDDAILKLIQNEEVRKRLPSIDLKLSMNPLRETGLKEGAKCMSVLTVASMTRGSYIKDEGLLDKYRSTISSYLQSVSKESELGAIGFFKILKDDEFKDPTQAGKLQKPEPTITSPTNKKS